MINIRIILLLILFVINNHYYVFSQSKKKSSYPDIIYNNHNYNDHIKTVQLYPLNNENGFPIIELNSKDQFKLSFDELGSTIKDYYISIEHCNSDWQPSRLSPLNYALGYNEDRITNYSPSSNTLQPYIHYQTIFPNENIKPKIAGNYLLKVYKDADKANIILTKRFYVVNSIGLTDVEIVPSPLIDKRDKYQKLNLNYKNSIAINNPHRELQLHIYQNQRPDNVQILHTPTFLANNEYRYDAINTLNFVANNEFRYTDLRSINGGSSQIEKIVRDSTITMYLFPDQDKIGNNYASNFDRNGIFYIRNENDEAAETNSDYINVIFSLQTSPKINGNIYLVGSFNNFIRNKKNKLEYDFNQKAWTTKQLLKQGIYDYEYVLEDEEGNLVTDAFSDSFFTTENDYQIIVYLRRTGTYWDEIINYKTITIHNKNIN